MHRDIVGADPPPSIASMLSTVAGLPAAIRRIHPTAVSADLAEPYARRAAKMSPHDPQVVPFLKDAMRWLGGRILHLRAEYARLTRSTPSSSALVGAGPWPAPVPGKMTAGVLSVLEKAWGGFVQAAKDFDDWALSEGHDLAKPFESLKLVTHQAGKAAGSLFRGAGEGLGGVGLGALVVVLLAILLLKG